MRTTSGNEATAQRAAPLRVVQAPVPVAAALRAAEFEALSIRAALEDGSEDVIECAWGYPFRIVRAVRGVPGITKRTDPSRLTDVPIAAYNILRSHFEDHEYADAGVFLDAFMGDWQRVKYGLGQGPVEEAHQRAVEAPLASIPGSRIRSGKFKLFVSFAYYLKQVMGDEPIYFIGRRIAPLFGVSCRTVHTWIDLAVLDGHLRVVDSQYRPGRARRFRFIPWEQRT